MISGGPYVTTGVTTSTYPLAAGDVGRYFVVVATGTGSYSGTVTSPERGPVTAGTTPLTSVSITGTTQVGNTLTANVLPVGATATYLWEYSMIPGGPYVTTGVTTSTYPLAPGDVGRYFVVVATGTGSYSGTVTSSQVGPVLTPITSARVTGFVAPVKGGAAETVGSLVSDAPIQYTVTSLTWTPAIGGSGKYATKTTYTATVVLTSATGYTFSTAITPTVNTGTPSAGTVTGTGSGNTLSFTVTFPATL
jgi:hypothetical protein